MFYFIVLVVVCLSKITTEEKSFLDSLDLKNEKGIFSDDEEYEDLRAELLAYHSALATLTSETRKDSRRSLGSTPCWHLGGICVNYKLCNGFQYMTEVPGCKDKLNVCCFTWNKYVVRDMREHGLPSVGYPWSKITSEYGGGGIRQKNQKEKLVSKKKDRDDEKKMNHDIEKDVMGMDHVGEKDVKEMDMDNEKNELAINEAFARAALLRRIKA